MFLPTNITLKLGDSGDFVSELQRRLSIVKCFNENAINGFFDGLTVNGVSTFQSMVGISADGIAGPETLRRLNGALSGDTSSTASDTNKAEEEARLAAANRAALEAQLAEQQAALLAQQQALMAQQAALTQQMVPPEAAVQPPQAYAPQPAAPVYQPAPVSPDVALQQQIQREMAMQNTAQSGPTAADILAQTLLEHTRKAAPPLQQQPPVQQQAPVQHAAPQAPVPQYNPAPQQHAQPVAQAPAQVPAQALVQEQPAAAAAESSRGLVGRTVRFASEMMQKLANHFESKLPAPVIEEVKQIGHTMAQSGMKEAPIPTGPEQQRAVEQGRGQQQQQSAALPQRH